MDQGHVNFLVNRILTEKNSAAFADLVDLHKNMVYSLCLKMCHSAEDAEEIAQDTFLKAYRSLSSFKGKSKFSTWLYQIAYFTTINHLRKNSLDTSAKFPLELAEADEHILLEFRQEERKKYLNQAFDYLTPDERALITFFYMEDHSIQEIAEIMHESVTNVKVKLHRTRKKLYAILDSLLKTELKSLI